jgi:hypothetical protein
MWPPFALPELKPLPEIHRSVLEAAVTREPVSEVTAIHKPKEDQLCKRESALYWLRFYAG